jgi:transcriptional regulator with XRE-family HTH domain
MDRVESERSCLEFSFRFGGHGAMDLKDALAVNLRRLRHARKMTQEELADRAGLSVRYVGSIERAAVSTSVTILGRLATALEVDPCELIRRRTKRPAG